MTYWVANLKDKDGETHNYYFECPFLWNVTDYIVRHMVRDRDFYGHKFDQTIGLEIMQLVDRPRHAVVIIV